MWRLICIPRGYHSLLQHYCPYEAISSAFNIYNMRHDTINRPIITGKLSFVYFTSLFLEKPVWHLALERHMIFQQWHRGKDPMQLTLRVSIHSTIPKKIFHNCKDSVAVSIPFICLALCKGVFTPSVSFNSRALKLERNTLILTAPLTSSVNSGIKKSNKFWTKPNVSTLASMLTLDVNTA